MRRRALMAASQSSGGGDITFFCHCVWRHPMTGVLNDRGTYTFVTKKGSTWLDVDGLFDINNKAYISCFIFNNEVGVSISVTRGLDDRVEEYYYSTFTIKETDIIQDGETYEFE